ncbi:SseB family protein [Candidatus Bathyarchaeota archaeon]|nr:MAG: SseB family protein [Candidatus Bathyarchaeota archaeon]
MKPRLPPEFVPENRLEELLVAAAKNTEVRPEFYRELITSSILTLGKLHSAHTVPENSHQYDTDNESEVRLVEYKGQPVVPIYSSMKRMTDVIPSEYYVNTGYFNINCKTLLQQLGPNRTYVLNPGHMVVLTLSPEQVNALLDGTIFKKLEDERKITMSLPTKQRISRLFPIDRRCERSLHWPDPHSIYRRASPSCFMLETLRTVKTNVRPNYNRPWAYRTICPRGKRGSGYFRSETINELIS